MINSKENKLLTTVALLKLINDSVKPEANVHFDPIGLPIKSNWLRIYKLREGKF